MMTHPYPCPRLIACTNLYFPFTFTGAFSLHAYGVTRNWRTYFTSVRRVFLVERDVLQTVLGDIRAWSARFLVNVTFNEFLFLLLQQVPIHSEFQMKLYGRAIYTGLVGNDTPYSLCFFKDGHGIWFHDYRDSTTNTPAVNTVPNYKQQEYMFFQIDETTNKVLGHRGFFLPYRRDVSQSRLNGFNIKIEDFVAMFKEKHGNDVNSCESSLRQFLSNRQAVVSEFFSAHILYRHFMFSPVTSATPDTCYIARDENNAPALGFPKDPNNCLIPLQRLLHHSSNGNNNGVYQQQRGVGQVRNGLASIGGYSATTAGATYSTNNPSVVPVQSQYHQQFQQQQLTHHQQMGHQQQLAFSQRQQSPPQQQQFTPHSDSTT